MLISANQVTTPYPVFPIGVAHLMGALLQKGHLADHFDLLACGGLAELENILRDKVYDVIGISIRNIDSVDSAAPRPVIDDIAMVVNIVRAHSKAPLVLGGPGFSIMPEELLRYLGADFGIVGEGEKAFPQLIDLILSGENIDRQIFSASLDNYPDYPPHFSENTSKYYVDHGGMLNIQTKRGCGYGCSYCSYPTIEGKRLRFRDPKEIVDEIQRLQREFNARYIFFTDGVFNDPKNHYLEVAEALIQADNRTPWCAFFRPQNLGISELRLLQKSGMAAMELGSDAACDETLAGLNKGFSFSDVHNINAAIVGLKIPCAHFIVFGGPGETQETVRKGLENINKLEGCIVFAYIGLRILPGTALYQRALSEKIVTAETDIIRPIFYYSPNVEREYMDRLLRQSFAGRMDRIYPMEDMESYVRLFHSLGHTGPLWDLMLHPRLKQ